MKNLYMKIVFLIVLNGVILFTPVIGYSETIAVSLKGLKTTAEVIIGELYKVKTGITDTGENYLDSKVAKSLAIDATNSKIQLVNDELSPGNNKFYGTNGSGTKGFYTVTGGASTFITLTDVPSSYSGQGGKYVRVNSGATGLEFVTGGGTGTTMYGGTGTFNSTTGEVITIGVTMDNTTYKVNITATSDPSGTLGEVWVTSKSTTQFTVKNSGSNITATYDWVVMP